MSTFQFVHWVSHRLSSVLSWDRVQVQHFNHSIDLAFLTVLICACLNREFNRKMNRTTQNLFRQGNIALHCVGGEGLWQDSCCEGKCCFNQMSLKLDMLDHKTAGVCVCVCVCMCVCVLVTDILPSTHKCSERAHDPGPWYGFSLRTHYFMVGFKYICLAQAIPK